MKLLTIASLLLAFTSAHASYFHTKCSSPSTGVNWESGHNSNSMNIEYYSNSGRQTMNVSLGDVTIVESDMVVLRDERVSDCAISSIASSTTVKAGKVVITATEDAPDTLANVHGGKIEAEVICETHFNSMMYCPETK